MGAADLRARLSVSPDGALIALVAPDHVALLDSEALTVTSEIGVDPDAEGSDAVLCGDPLRLVVLSRYGSSARLHVIDPVGPVEVAELALRSPMRLVAASGAHVWLLGPGGSTAVDVTGRELLPSPLPLRAAVSAVGAFGDGRFLASTGGVLEEWNPSTRAPARRFRLSRPLQAQFVGGGARQAWLVPAEGDRVEVVPLVNHGQPGRIDLPEPVARVAPDPGHENLVAIGARSGAVYLVDLTGKKPPAPIDAARGTDVAWLGPHPSIVLASPSSELGVEIVPLVGRGRGTGGEPAPMPPARSVPVARPVAPASSAPASSTARMIGGAGPAAASGGRRDRSAKRGIISEWDTEPASSGWRDRVASWAQSVMAGSRSQAPELTEGPAVSVAERLGIGGELAEALWLVYGAHLNGIDGVSAIDLTQVIDRRWAEVLGHGHLAASGALRWRKSRIHLWPEVRAVLDEAPPPGAWIASEAAPPDDAVAVIARDADLVAVARWLAPQVGPLLVPGERPRTAARRALAARARGGLAVLRWPAADHRGSAPAALLVVADEAAARAAGAPVIATWPG